MSSNDNFVPPSATPPLVAPLEAHSRHPAAVDQYMPEGALRGPYFAMQGEFMNLALFHRAAYETVRARDITLDALAAGTPKDPPSDTEDDELEVFFLQQSRHRTRIHAGESENAAIAGYADELTVIGLWAIAEKYLGMALETLSPGLSDYRWDRLKEGFSTQDIDLSQLPGSNGADECRLLNNAIKHAGVVTERLAKLPAFSGLEAKPIRRVKLDLQRYMGCVHNLVGAAMEEASSRLAGTFPDPRRGYGTDRDGNIIARAPLK